MPSFIVVKSAISASEATDAIMCEPNAVTGVPDRRTDVPVQVSLVNEHTLSVDGVNHRIASSVGANGTTTYLVNGSSKSLRNRERRVALATATDLLRQLTAVLRPLATASAEPETVTENLQMLFDWVREERERLTVAA
jgi:hypothetical protein